MSGSKQDGRLSSRLQGERHQVAIKFPLSIGKQMLEVGQCKHDRCSLGGIPVHTHNSTHALLRHLCCAALQIQNTVKALLKAKIDKHTATK